MQGTGSWRPGFRRSYLSPTHGGPCATESGKTRPSDEPKADKVRDAFDKCKRAINKDTPAYTFHGLRHTYGTLMIQSGVNIVDVAHHMGHSSTQVTEKYLHAADKQLAAQVNSIDFAIS